MRHKKDVNIIFVFVCCLKRERIDNISVKDLSMVSKLSRNAFYVKFNSKEEFYINVFNKILENLDIDNNDSISLKFYKIIDYLNTLINNYYYIFKKLSKRINNDEIIDIIKEVIYKKLETKNNNINETRFIKEMIVYIIETIIFYCSNIKIMNEEFNYIKNIINKIF